jgi:hypothetical protein
MQHLIPEVLVTQTSVALQKIRKMIDAWAATWLQGGLPSLGAASGW